MGKDVNKVHHKYTSGVLQSEPAVRQSLLMCSNTHRCNLANNSVCGDRINYGC